MRGTKEKEKNEMKMNGRSCLEKRKTPSCRPFTRLPSSKPSHTSLEFFSPSFSFPYRIRVVFFFLLRVRGGWGLGKQRYSCILSGSSAQLCKLF